MVVVVVQVVFIFSYKTDRVIAHSLVIIAACNDFIIMSISGNGRSLRDAIID